MALLPGSVLGEQRAPGDSTRVGERASHARRFSSFRDPAAGKSRRFTGRLWIEGGYSQDLESPTQNDPDGYSIDLGVEWGATFLLAASLSFEHYPFPQPERVETAEYLGGTRVRTFGGGNRHLYGGAIGLRVRLPLESIVIALETDFGQATGSTLRRTVVNDTTGAVIEPPRRHSEAGILGAYGLTIRTRRRAGPDFYVGIRQRTVGLPLEGDASRSVQLRFGVITR